MAEVIVFILIMWVISGISETVYKGKKRGRPKKKNDTWSELFH